MTLGFQAKSLTTLATEARLVVRSVPLFYAYITPKDLPWLLTLEVPQPFVDARSSTLVLPIFTCLLPLASSRLLGDRRFLPFFSPLRLAVLFEWNLRLGRSAILPQESLPLELVSSAQLSRLLGLMLLGLVHLFSDINNKRQSQLSFIITCFLRYLKYIKTLNVNVAKCLHLHIGEPRRRIIILPTNRPPRVENSAL